MIDRSRPGAITKLTRNVSNKIIMFGEIIISLNEHELNPFRPILIALIDISFLDTKRPRWELNQKVSPGIGPGLRVLQTLSIPDGTNRLIYVLFA